MTTPSSPQWVFELQPPMGGARATAWRDTLEGANFAAEARIAREAIQNSVDATLPNEKTEIVVRNKTLSPDEAASVRDALALNSPDSPVGRLDILGLPDDNAFRRLSEGAEGGVRTTVIEDWNAYGLGYDAVDGKDRFAELCLYLGQDSANVDAARGGSYGFGKTVYEQASDCRTFIVYSAFEPSEETGGHYSRLFACSHFVGHKTRETRGGGGKKYTGRAWYGIRSEESGAGVKCDPVTDEDAARLAKRLGFEVRSESESDWGTSIMILGSALDLDKFREAVEDYWWPRIMSNELTVELKENDAPKTSPEPIEREDLEPYIRCYGMATGEADAGENDRKYQFNRYGGVRRGTLGLTPLGPDDSDDEEGADGQTPFRNSVALIRSGPKMVVQYKNPGGRLPGDYAGVFFSDPEAEEYLHLSEPPSHDDWIPNSARLKEKCPNDGYALVRSIQRTIGTQTRNYQRILNPPPKPTPMGGTDALKRILAGLMSGAGLGTNPPTPSPSQDPFNMTIQESRANSSAQSSVRAEVTARLRDDAPMERSDAVMTVRPTVAMDDNLVRGEAIGLSKVAVDGEARDMDGGSDIAFEISKDRDVSVEIESAEFDRDLYADLEVSIRIIEPEPDESNDD